MSEIDKAKAYYQAHLKSRYGTPRGCSTEEVDALEKQVGHPLPAAYREFLLWMGKDKEGVFRGSDWFVNTLRATPHNAAA
ncbi:MAG TPA: SMI1/KNR4 family protein [Polyangiaceae bacterium]|nr:SMI1/KNR4 family protein [Polyangiaceae bacterium]